jgi:hypothetical protein
MRLSGTGTILIKEQPRGEVSYDITIVRSKEIISADGVLAGDFATLFEAWQAGEPIVIAMADGRSMRGILSSVTGGRAIFRSSGEQVGF